MPSNNKDNKMRKEQEHSHPLNDNCYKAIVYLARAKARVAEIKKQYTALNCPEEILGERYYLENIIKQLDMASDPQGKE